MKSKKGFTLVELLSVIIILGIIGLIVYPVINKSIKTSKINSYERQKDIILSEARKWGVKNTNLLPDIGSNDIYCLTISKLKQEGYIENRDIIDPRTKDTFLDGNIKISYSSDFNQYEYNYVEEGC